MILTRKIIEAMEKYQNRREDVIYAHMLDKPFWNVTKERRITNEMIIGELVHIAVENLLEKSEEKCKNVQISSEGGIPEAIERFVHTSSDGKEHVTVCGSPDAIHKGVPVEVKTTRKRTNLTHPRREWVNRARVYGWLYNSDKTMLIVIDLITGKEKLYELTPYSDDDMRTIIEGWLRGEYPITNLHFHQHIGGDIRSQQKTLREHRKTAQQPS